jgi:acyl-CoA dehydrogenase
MTYTTIAREKAAAVERTGLLGEGSAGRQVVARFFIEGFGTAEQRAHWLPHLTSVAISEPRVGAHPKLLTTRAVEDSDGYCISGEKAWVTNGPLADVFIVFAVTSVEDGRKRYSAFLVPRDTPGLTTDEAPQYRALAPSRHCGLKLNSCRVPRSALLGQPRTAYETIALPFRDVEDAVGTYGWLGAFRFLSATLEPYIAGDAAKLSLGGIIALIAVFAAAAESVVAALDAGALASHGATLVGLRVLATDMLQRVRAHRVEFGPTSDDAIERAFRDLDVSLSIARGPRQARQARLAG